MVYYIDYPVTLLVVSVEGHYGAEEEWRKGPRPQEQMEYGSMTYSTASDTVTAQEGTKIPGIKDTNIGRVANGLCYTNAETLGDAEQVVRWWWYNFV